MKLKHIYPNDNKELYQMTLAYIQGYRFIVVGFNQKLKDGELFSSNIAAVNFAKSSYFLDQTHSRADLDLDLYYIFFEVITIEDWLYRILTQ